MSRAGATPGVRNIKSARFTIKNGIAYGENPFANNFDAVHRAGHESKFTVEGTFTSFVEQSTFSTAGGEIYQQWVNNIFSGDSIRIRCISAADGDGPTAQFPLAEVTDDLPYAFDIYLPNASIREGNAPISTPGTLPLDWAYKGFIAPVGTTVTAMQTDHKAPVVFQFFVANADDSASFFNAALEGGNAPAADLVV